jgi:hypothetical protein
MSDLIVTLPVTYECGCVLNQDSTGLIWMDRCQPCMKEFEERVRAMERRRSANFSHAIRLSHEMAKHHNRRDKP